MTSQTPLVTVAMPAFNHEAYVRQALDSVLESGLPSVELVICDDASSDATSEIIRAWASANAHKLSRFEFIQHQLNRGLSASLNEIIAASRGEIIHIIASDDFFLPGGLAKKSSALLEHPEWDAVFSDASAVGPEGQVHQESLLASSQINPARLSPSMMPEELLYHWDYPANLLSWRRRVFKCHGGEFEYDNTVFCEDFDSVWWAMRRHSLGFTPAICMGYRVRSWPQTSDRNPVRERRDIAYVLAKNAGFFPPHLGQVMLDYSMVNFYTATGESNARELCLEKFLKSKELYQERSSKDPNGSIEDSVQLSRDASKANDISIAHRIALLESSLAASLKAREKDHARQEEKIAKLKGRIRELQHQIRHYSSTPFRSMKLWLNRRSIAEK